MKDPHAFLVAVDDSEASRRAVAYVGEILANVARPRVILFHVLPPIPPRLLDFGGCADPDEERAVTQRLDRQTRDWRQARECEADPLMHAMRDVLRSSGVPIGDVEVSYAAPLPEETIGQQILSVATRLKCRTVVVGRAPRHWWEALFHRHPSGALLGPAARGLTIWVVE